MGAQRVPVSEVQALCFRAKRGDSLAGRHSLGMRFQSSELYEYFRMLLGQWHLQSDALRTSLHEDESGRVYGLLHDDAPERVEVLEGRFSLEDATAQLARLTLELPADLGTLPHIAQLVAELDDGAVLAVMQSEHVIHDGAALASIAAGFVAAASDDAPSARTYQEYVAIEQALLAGPEAERRVDWWEEHLRSALPFGVPEGDRGPGPMRGVLAEVGNVPWPAGSASDAPAIFDVVCAALVFAVQALEPPADVVFNMPWSRRSIEPGFETTAGNMVDYLPLRLAYDPVAGMEQAAAAVAAERRASQAHYLPLGYLLERLGLSWGADPTPLLQVMVNLLPPSAAPILLAPTTEPIPFLPGIYLCPIPASGRTLERHDLGLLATRIDGSLRWRLGMRHDVYAAGVHATIDDRFRRAIEAGVADPSAPLGRLDD